MVKGGTLHSSTGRNVTIELALVFILSEILPNCELLVDSLLRDTKVLHIEEAFVLQGRDKCLRKLLLSLWGVEKG
jgi:hypothetical protein